MVLAFAFVFAFVPVFIGVVVVLVVVMPGDRGPNCTSVNGGGLGSRGDFCGDVGVITGDLLLIDVLVVILSDVKESDLGRYCDYS